VRKLPFIMHVTHNETLAVKYSENQLLTRAFFAQDIHEKNALLSRFMSDRKYRMSLLGDIIKQEYLSGTIEGMAEYAGSMVLKQISTSKYTNRVEGYIKNLQSFDERFFDIRRMLYFTGATYCIALSDAAPPSPCFTLAKMLLCWCSMLCLRVRRFYRKCALLFSEGILEALVPFPSYAPTL